ncbi:MAG: cobaltochelatase subunit CobN [Candidatus Bathyarchaeota archaeon]|nr:cobaltochelatase subunit CobN [Candidatus Bathyarchaeota archaeon]
MNPLRIAFITTIPNDVVPLICAVKDVNKNGEVVKLRVQSVAHARDFDDFGAVDSFTEFAKTAHVAVVHLMGSSTETESLIGVVKAAGVPCFVSSASLARNQDLLKHCTVEPEDYQAILSYLMYGGKKNLANLLLYLANRFTGTTYPVDASQRPQWEGLYHPDFDYYPTLEQYEKTKLAPNKPTICLWFNQNHLLGGNTDFIDGLIREVERQGANVLPLFFKGVKDEALGTKGLEWLVENYCVKDGKSIVDVVINVLSFSLPMSVSDPKASTVFLNKLGVPIIKAILTCNTVEEWQKSAQGLNPVDIGRSVALPEFDGDLITVPAAAMDFRETDPLTGAKIIKFKPLPERIQKLVRLSLNWAKLRHTPNKDKRVAIIFHNYPPRNDTIGKAFGLDTPASVLNLLRGLKTAGYTVESIPESSQDLIETVLSGLTNDCRWSSSQELNQKALDKIPLRQYMNWFNELPADAQAKMQKDWGNPPGKLLSLNGNLLIAGLINGNIFVGMQPPRGFTEDPASIYHSPDLSMPHHYYAYYRWIRDTFKADVIMHVGTHGTLEWLPGKSIGLSASCAPDAAISDLPHIYHYIISNPGEGTQAKRRSYCCLIDHLIPVMHDADAYGDIAELEVMLQDYYHAKLSDPEKLPHMQQPIWDKTCQTKFNQDLNITQKSAFADFEAFLETLHSYLHELSDTQIRDGLHILGEAPSDLHLETFLATLTRLSNGEVPSLREAIAQLQGYNYEELLSNPGKMCGKGKTNGDLLKQLTQQSLELIKAFNTQDFNKQAITQTAQEVLGKTSPHITCVLEYVADFLAPAITQTRDELKHTLSACEGAYVPAGPSGSPTRGMCDVLPSGRNFYSVDPRAIPSPAAWRVGVSMGDALLERYLKDEGKYPENIGMVVWATDTMRTKGDDVAQILYLMGVEPVWEKTSGRVKGVKAIPAKELKHPRIDVTVRISGLFRDTFPDVANVLDDAVRTVAQLNESPDKNYLAKHVAAETQRRLAQGESAEVVKEQAQYRIFSARPGTYGCGISEAIDSKNWKNQADLANIYVTWGGYAYGRKTYGAAVPEQFKQRLSQLNLTVKNDNTREYDILDSDDWYDAHGGMVSAVKTFSGQAPNSYCGDSSDPDRVKVRSTQEETCHVLRSRLLNPKYIESMQRHGYQGAGELSRSMDSVFGWDATVEAVEDWMYEDLAQKYVLDEKMQQWLKQVNPYALQNMTERLLEAIERGMWQTTDEMKKQLQRLYLAAEGLLEEANEKR